MKKLIAIAFLIMLYISGCDSFITQPNNVVYQDNPDSVLTEYNNGIEFLGQYFENLHPHLRLDSSETYADTPSYIAQGTLFIYYYNHLVDSVPYGSAYHESGLSRPIVTAGYISDDNEYLLKFQNEHDDMYFAGKSIWYIINATGIHRLSKVLTKEKNGLYENNNVILSKVRKSQISNRIIFFGEYYCHKQTYCTFDLNTIIKNYPRKRMNCYAEWEWE